MKHYVVLALALLGGCARLPSPVVQADPKHKEWMLAAPMVWQISKDHKIIVPEGFVTDFASIPPGVNLFLPRHASYSTASVVHDYLYWAQGCTKDQADNIFWIAMRRDGVGKAKRILIYAGVQSIGGDIAWKGNANFKKEGLVKVLSPEVRPVFLQNSLKEARRVAKEQGAVDPPFEENPAYCSLGNDRKLADD